MLAIVVAAIAVAAILVAVLALRRVTPGPSLAGKTVVIHTQRPDDRTLKGVLHGQHSDRWVLRDAVAVMPGGFEQPLGGTEHVPVANISFVQEVEGIAKREKVTA